MSVRTIHINKIGVTLPLSPVYDLDFPGHTEPPIRDELKAYRKWKRAFKKLRKIGHDNLWYSDGGNDYGPTFNKPEGTWVRHEGPPNLIEPPSWLDLIIRPEGEV